MSINVATKQTIHESEKIITINIVVVAKFRSRK